MKTSLPSQGRGLKIYIAGPISGLPEAESWDIFLDAEKKLRERFPKARIYNPRTCIPQSINYEDQMKICLFQVESSNTIFLIDGWNRSSGAKRELAKALICSLTILTTNDIQS